MTDAINHQESTAPETKQGNAGAGRKINSQSKQTISARELREKLLRTGQTPLDVMVDGMRQAKGRHDRLEKKLDEIDLDKLDADSMKALTDLVSKAKAYLSEARECAKDAAPYLHPKLEPTGRFVEITLPTIKGPADIVEAQAAVIKAVATGDLTTDEGSKMSAILENRRRAIETDEHAQRLKAIEEKMGIQPQWGHK